MGVKNELLRKKHAPPNTGQLLTVHRLCSQSTHVTSRQWRKLPMPACSRRVCFLAELHGNSRFQLASALHHAPASAVASLPLWNLCQMWLDSKQAAPQLRPALRTPAEQPPPAQDARGRSQLALPRTQQAALCWMCPRNLQSPWLRQRQNMLLLVCAWTYLCKSGSPNKAWPPLWFSPLG